MKLFLRIFFISLVTLAPAFAIPQNAEVEVLHTQALLEFNSGQYERCASLTNKLLLLDPGNIAALELRALMLRREHNDEAATAVYENLLKTAPPEKKASYHFELATIRYKQKKIAQAHEHFENAVSGKVNSGTSHFFLGLIDFNAKQWRKARQHFTAALTYSDADSMRAVTRYYLANSYTQLGKQDMAIHNYYQVEADSQPSDESTSSQLGNNTLTGDIRKNALKELKALDRGGRFISISMLQQWDGNVQTNPANQNSADVTSKERSFKAVFNGAIGYATSPTKKFQITPSYRFYTNYNYNYLARDFNFFTQTPSLYVIYRPYARFSVGMRAEGTFSMKNTVAADESASKIKYRPYNLAGDIGPIAKYSLTPRIRLAGEASWRPNLYYVDPPGGDSRRTGSGLLSRLSSEFLTDLTWLNPIAYMSYQWDHTEGKNFRMHGVGGGLSNAVSYTEKLSFTGSLDFLLADYGDTKNPERNDQMLTFRLLTNYLYNQHWSFMVDASQTFNSSTDTTYFYSRFVTSFGATYMF